MPDKRTIKRALKDKRAGKAPTTQAGEFVREEIHKIRRGEHGARSPQQAVAIGLSKARRAGVGLRPPGVSGTVDSADLQLVLTREQALGKDSLSGPDLQYQPALRATLAAAEDSTCRHRLPHSGFGCLAPRAAPPLLSFLAEGAAAPAGAGRSHSRSTGHRSISATGTAPSPPLRSWSTQRARRQKSNPWIWRRRCRCSAMRS